MWLLSTQSVLPACVRTLRLARRPLSMQSIRSNAAFRKVSTIHARCLFERYVSRDVNYPCKVSCPLAFKRYIWQSVNYPRRVNVRTLYLARFQMSMRFYPHDFRSNASSGGRPTTYAKCVPRFRRNVERKTNYCLHVALAFKHYVWRDVTYPRKVLLQLPFKRFVWRGLNYPHRVHSQLLYGRYVWRGIHIHEV